MSRREVEKSELRAEIAAFRESFNVAFLASTDGEGMPEASHAPFILSDGNFYILISQLAKHTRNLLVREQVSLLLLEAGMDKPNPYALRRLQYLCLARVIDRIHEAERHSELISQFRKKFGKFVETLNALGDFQLFELKPESGKYVKGFAQTFVLGVGNEISVDHVTGNQPKL